MNALTHSTCLFETVRRWLCSQGAEVSCAEWMEPQGQLVRNLVFAPYGDDDLQLELRFAGETVDCLIGDWRRLALQMSVEAGAHGGLFCGGLMRARPEQLAALLNAFAAHGFAVRASVLRHRIVQSRLLYDARGGRHLPGPEVSAFAFMGQTVQRQWRPWQLPPLQLDALACA